MRTRFFQIALALLVTAAPIFAGQVVERIVATVNGHPILQSDWDEAVRYEAFVNHRSLDSFTPQDRKATLDRMIDQELLREQLKDSEQEQVPAQQIEERLREIRKTYLGAQDGSAWNADLAKYALSEPVLRQHIRLQFDLTHLVESRLRPNVHVDRDSIEAYYREKLLPQLRKSGVHEVPLAEASPRIRDLLAQQRMDELLNAWIRDLRQQGRIRVPSALEEGVAVR